MAIKISNLQNFKISFPTPYPHPALPTPPPRRDPQVANPSVFGNRPNCHFQVPDQELNTDLVPIWAPPGPDLVLVRDVLWLFKFYVPSAPGLDPLT